MHFDINKLKGRLDFLEVLLNNTNDKYKRREILNDIKKIKYLIREITIIIHKSKTFILMTAVIEC